MLFSFTIYYFALSVPLREFKENPNISSANGNKEKIELRICWEEGEKWLKITGGNQPCVWDILV